MKKNLTTILCLLVGINLLQAQQLSFSKDLIPHPRLLLLEGGVKVILENIEKDQNLARINREIIANCNEIIDLPTLERIQIGRRLLDKSREALRRIFYLSYAYRTTGEERFFKRCEAEMLKISGFSDWNPSHFLDVAEMTMAVSIGYDWLYNQLPESSRKTIKEAILAKGLQASENKKYNSWLKATHNWNQVCNAGISFGALATYEEYPKYAFSLMERSLKSIHLPMEDYMPDGAYPEGYGYWGYGTSFNVMYISSLEKVYKTDFGLSQAPGFLKTASYYLHMAGPSGYNFNYSDSGDQIGFSPAIFWFSNVLKDPSLLAVQNKVLADNTKNLTGNRLLPAAMVWSVGLNTQESKAPTKLFYTGGGKNPVAMFRSSWTDPDAVYVGFKAGSPNVNHGHMDIGSFVMDALGERWALDLGMQSYESLESLGIKLWDKTQEGQRWEILRYNNHFHNTLSFDNQLQKVEGYAGIDNFTQNPGFMSAISDLSAIYPNMKIKRGVALLDKKWVVVKDEIAPNENENMVHWNMLTPAKIEYLRGNTAKLSQNGKVLFLKITEPQNAEFVSSQAKSDNAYDAPNEGVTRIGFEVKIPKNTATNLTVWLVPEEDIVPEKIKPLNLWKD